MINNTTKKNSILKSTTLIYFILMCFFIFIRISAALNWFSFLGGFSELFYTICIQVFVMAGIPLVFFTRSKKQGLKQTLKDFSFKKVSFKAILFSILIGVIVYFLVICVSSVFNFIIRTFGYFPNTSSGSASSYSWAMLIYQIVITAVLPGICEEIAHRGMLLKGLSTLGARSAILLSGLLFGLLHFNIEQFFYATLIGFLLGYITATTGSIFPAIIIHFMNNFLSVVMGFVIFNYMPNFSYFGFLGDNFFAMFSSILLMLAVAICGLVGLIYALFKETRLKRLANVADKIVKDQLRADLLQQKLPQSEGMDIQQNVIVDGQRQTVNIKFPTEEFGMLIKPQEKLNIYNSMFIIGSLLLGILTTVSTFIWGTL